MIKELIPVIGTAVLLAGCNGGESQTDKDAVGEGEQQPGGNESEQFIANSNIVGTSMIAVATAYPAAEPYNIGLMASDGSLGVSPRWTVTTAPKNAQYTITSPSSATTGFIADTPGEYEIELTVSNEQGVTSTSSHKITVVEDLDGDGVVDSNDNDLDGDGFFNENDLFQNDKASHSDTNSDGISNYHDKDEDKDGVLDLLDQYPFDDSKSDFPLYEERETSSSNNGINVAETISDFPFELTGTLSSATNYEQDYFRLSLPTGALTFNVKFGNDKFSGNLLLVDGSGNPISYSLKKLSKSQILINAVNATEGSYYLVLTQPKNGDVISYSVSGYIDTDHDGLSDAIELAIDSNPNNADSDSDLVSDYVEAYGSLDNNVDPDNDGLPSWWDLDSDGDHISDTVEMLNTEADVDNDGYTNNLDLDSDNNGITDSVEFGDDPRTPINSDSDSIADYLDLDNDNDGVDDSMDPSMDTPIEPLLANNPITINSISFDGQLVSECREGQVLTLDLSDSTPFGEDTLLIAKGSSNSKKVDIPFAWSDDDIVFNCDDGPLGSSVNLFVTDGNSASTEYGMNFRGTGELFVSSVSLNGSYITINGANLNQEFTLKWDGGEYDYDNSRSSNATRASFYLPNDFKKGFSYIEYLDGRTSTFYVNYEDQQNIEFIVNEVEGLDRSALYASTIPGNKTLIGSANTDIDVSSVSGDLITLTLEETDQPIKVVGYLPTIPAANNFTLNSSTTGLGLLWRAMNKDWVQDADALTVYNNLLALPEIQALGEYVYQQLRNDDTYLAKFDLYSTSEYTNALVAVSQKLPSNQGNVSTQKVDVYPKGETDGFTVQLEGGEVIVDNDTKLFVAFEYADDSGTPLCGFGDSLFSQSFVGPQSSYLYWAGQGKCYEGDFSAYKSGNVRILTPGYDVSYDAQLTPAMLSTKEKRIRELLAMRSIAESLVLPVFNGALDIIGLQATKAENLITVLSETPWFLTEIAAFSTGGQQWEPTRDAIKRKLYEDVLSYGTFSQLFVEKVLRSSFDAGELIKKNAVKAVPFFGQVWTAVHTGTVVAGTGLELANYGYDMANRDTVIDFTVTAPIEIESVEPRQLIEPEEPVRVVIKGVGMYEYKEHWYSTPVKPTIKITNNTTGETEEISPYHIEDDGSEIWAMAPQSLFIKGTKYDIEVTSAEDKAGSSTLNDAIEVVNNETYIDFIEAVEGSQSNEFMINGYGFSTISSDNQIMLDDETQLLVSSASETSLLFRLPVGLETGEHTIKVRNTKFGQNAEWSNASSIEVLSSNVSAIVCDNGGAKDDNYALDIDGIRVGQTFTTWSNYCFTFELNLSAGYHTATLIGLDAPDGIGTYSIRFQGVESVSGDYQSGNDLEPSTPPKHYRFKVAEQVTTTKAVSLTTRSIAE